MTLDQREASQGAAEGISQVDAAANEPWKIAVLETIRQVARSNSLFVADDVWDELSTEQQTRDLRALGPVMLNAKRQGWIEKTDDYKLSKLATSHRHPRPVWRSLIFEAAACCQTGAYLNGLLARAERANGPASQKTNEARVLIAEHMQKYHR